MGKTHIPCKLTKCLQSIYQPFRVKLKKREGHLVGAGRGFDFTSLFSAFLLWAKSSCGDHWPDAEKPGNTGGAVLASLTSVTHLKISFLRELCLWWLCHHPNTTHLRQVHLCKRRRQVLGPGAGAQGCAVPAKTRSTDRSTNTHQGWKVWCCRQGKAPVHHLQGWSRTSSAH